MRKLKPNEVALVMDAGTALFLADVIRQSRNMMSNLTVGAERFCGDQAEVSELDSKIVCAYREATGKLSRLWRAIVCGVSSVTPAVDDAEV